MTIDRYVALTGEIEAGGSVRIELTQPCRWCHGGKQFGTECNHCEAGFVLTDDGRALLEFLALAPVIEGGGAG